MNQKTGNILFLFRKAFADEYDVLGKTKTIHLIEGGELTNSDGQRLDLSTLIPIAASGIYIIDYILVNFKKYREKRQLDKLRKEAVKLLQERNNTNNKDDISRFEQKIDTVFKEIEAAVKNQENSKSGGGD